MLSYSTREPTVEDTCGTTGHEITDYVDPQTGWPTCHCGIFVLPAGGEPHDEYTAAVADLIEAYATLLGKAFDNSNPSYASIRRSELRVMAHKALDSYSPQYLRALLESLQNTDPKSFLTLNSIEDDLTDYYIAIGMHLEYRRRKIVSEVVLGESFDLSGTSDGTIIEVNERNVGLARTAARLVSLLNEECTESHIYRATVKQLTVISPILEHRQDMIQIAAQLYNTRGVSDATTQQILELTANDDALVHMSVADGLL